jgi:hypothetical protein
MVLASGFEVLSKNDFGIIDSVPLLISESLTRLKCGGSRSLSHVIHVRPFRFFAGAPPVKKKEN